MRDVSICYQVTTVPLGARVYPTATKVAPCLVRGRAATPPYSTLQQQHHGVCVCVLVASSDFHVLPLSAILE